MNLTAQNKQHIDALTYREPVVSERNRDILVKEDE